LPTNVRILTDTTEQISFPLQPSLARKGIDFVQATVERIDPEQQFVETSAGSSAGTQRIPFDYLVIATGPHVDFAAVEGLGPHGGYTQSVCTADHAVDAGKAWQQFLQDPGPVIVGATEGASCFGAAYESGPRA
jgi:sulfide:quinone oxidoreductase